MKEVRHRKWPLVQEHSCRQSHSSRGNRESWSVSNVIPSRFGPQGCRLKCCILQRPVCYRGFDSSFKSSWHWRCVPLKSTVGPLSFLFPFSVSDQLWVALCTVLPTLRCCLVMRPKLRVAIGCGVNPLKAWAKIWLSFFISWFLRLFVIVTQRWQTAKW